MTGPYETLSPEARGHDKGRTKTPGQDVKGGQTPQTLQASRTRSNKNLMLAS